PKAAGPDHHAGARALVAADRLSRAAGRPGLRIAGDLRPEAGDAAARFADRAGMRAGPGGGGAVLHRRARGPRCGARAAVVAPRVPGAAAVTAATAALWASMRRRTKPEPLER